MRQRQHVNPLTACLKSFDGQALDLDPSKEIELEVGCAEAQFLIERARQDSDRIYLGIEVRSQLVDEVNEYARAENLPVKAIFCNANHHLLQLLRPGSVSRVYLNFPDPWFKRRHRKRRMITEQLARDLALLLKPGHEVFIQSDVWSVALDAMEIFERVDDLYSNRAGPWSFWREGNPYGVRSWREQHCEEDGLPIWRMMYDRHAAQP